MRPVTTMGGLRFRQSFRYDIQSSCAALGGAEVRVDSADWHHSNQGEVRLTVGGRRVLLMEITDRTEGAAEAVFSSLESGDAPIADPRWQGAQRLLVQVRATLSEQPLVVEATQELSRQLQARFRMLAELSGPDAAQVWSDQEQRAAMVAELESELADVLSAVEALHQLSIRRRQEALSESDLGPVQTLLDQLRAQEEVSQPEGETARARLQRLAASHAAKEPRG